ncbi:NIPSNAP family protein [Candidatus Lucifugimonas marina]|uniref:NIPSNAP domain-containing protein n=1 Tax=Candidatus Lucifugimonas marina TaxID=3038979 RepID=A0AAJ5ZH79_9CHLR|nr:hypothetical protein [SAR202 cluster bacterium JH702]MDG0870707.1 hypothetical protein [SAR202 cluster bacterium JH639]WFG34791.1 hypothetical protein GKN94_03540 [SAR202 cluster bacterium JH545]WFG38731.1 hypothetical protein GKO48_03620 [SAR202 cluster bacterium JH1073]
MIYEFRTYDLFPGTLPKYEATLTESLSAGRLNHSDLFAYLYSEFGQLNQALHIWPYESLDARQAIREETTGITGWPPPTGDLLDGQAADIYFPAPFNDESITGDQGPFYELRTYTYATGQTPEVIDTWGKAIDERRKMSPFIGAWYTELGTLNKWAHLWGYSSLEHRAEVRKEAVAKGIWPPKGAPTARTQANQLFMPFPFSPLK